MIYRMELTYYKIVDLVDIYYTGALTIGYTPPYEDSDLKLDVKVFTSQEGKSEYNN